MSNQDKLIKSQPSADSGKKKPADMLQNNVSQFSEMSLDEVAEVLSLTIKHDTDNKLIAFLCMLSAYTDSSQINVSFNAPSSSGKTYIATEVAKLFPTEDKIELSGASPTSFFHGEGVLDAKRKAKIVSLERKILLMYEQPNPLLQQKLRAVLSHDQRELNYRITNKDKKGSQRAELIIIRGFASTVFCSAGMQLDEQEATRAILLSPEATEDKLKYGVHLQAIRGADEDKFTHELEANIGRINLKDRIIAIRNMKVDDIIIDRPDEIEKRFHSMFTKLKPRNMRDMGHLMKLIKSVALLNIWNRKDSSGAYIANQADIDNGFKLWSKVIESQDLNVPPAVMAFYKDYILPAYFEKKRNPIYSLDINYENIGLTNHELSSYYLRIQETTLNEELLRKQILPQLENSGLIRLDQPAIGDRRSKHIFPKWFRGHEMELKAGNNVGSTSGGADELDEILRKFFRNETSDVD